MNNKITKTISVHQLQAKASKVVKEVNEGQTYHIMRYSKPVAVLMSQKEYECLTGECRGCVKQLMNELKTKNSKLKTKE